MKLFDKPVMYDVIDVNVDQYRDAETVFDYAEHSTTVFLNSGVYLLFGIPFGIVKHPTCYSV